MTILEVMASISTHTVRTRSDFFTGSLAGLLLTAGLLFVAAGNLAAQQRLLTIDDIYDPGRRVNFGGNPAP